MNRLVQQVQLSHELIGHGYPLCLSCRVSHCAALIVPVVMSLVVSLVVHVCVFTMLQSLA